MHSVLYENFEVLPIFGVSLVFLLVVEHLSPLLVRELEEAKHRYDFSADRVTWEAESPKEEWQLHFSTVSF